MWWQAVRPQPWSAGSTTATRPWRISIRIAALDPYRGYASAVRSVLGTAVRVLDAFHVVLSDSPPSTPSAAASKTNKPDTVHR
jgi:hypothetical protein